MPTKGTGNCYKMTGAPSDQENLIAIFWRINGIMTGDKTRNTIDMETINMLIAMFGVAAAIAAIGS